MRFSFGIRRNRAGGWRLGTLPVFDLEGWEREPGSENAIVYRPTLKSLFWNVAALVLPLTIVGCLFWTVPLPWIWGAMDRGTAGTHSAEEQAERQQLDEHAQVLAESLKQRMSDSQWQEFAARQRATQERRQAERERLQSTGRRIGYVVWAVLAPVILVLVWTAARFGLYDLLRYGFDRVEIQTDQAGRLVVRRPGLFGLQEIIRPLHHLSHLELSVREEVTRRPYSHQGWVWFVVLFSKATVGEPHITFSIERVHRQPDSESPPPPRTQQFLQRLQQLAGVPVRSHTNR